MPTQDRQGPGPVSTYCSFSNPAPLSASLTGGSQASEKAKEVLRADLKNESDTTLARIRLM